MKRLWLPLVVGLTLNFLLAPAQAATRTWGGTSNGDWFDSTKWVESSVPVGGDVVTVSSGSILLTNSTEYLESLTITNATITFTNFETALQATNVILQNNGKFQHVVCVTNGALVYTNRIYVLCSNLDVRIGGLIDANSSGFTGRFANAGIGPGAGEAPGGTGVYGGGGSYGGKGGPGGPAGGSYPSGPTYGSTSQPVDPGSSGGAGAGTGGNGGGAVWIEATGTVTVAGTIRANGGNGNGDQAAAGSGGGICIRCQTIQGSGTVEAKGGNLGGNGGGGGGGRIAIYFDAAAQSALSPKPPLVFSTLGGSAYDAWRNGNIGSLYFNDSTILALLLSHAGELVVPGFTSWAPDSLTVSNANLLFPTGMVITVTNNLTVCSNATLILTNTPSLAVGGDLVLTNGGSLYVHSAETNGATYGCLLSIAKEILIYSNATLYPYAHVTNGGSVRIVASNVTVGFGGRINGDGGGFGQRTNNNTRGYGNGGGFGNTSGGGGGYGGMGGYGNPGHGSNGGGPTYGSSNTPPMYAGSAGGRGNSGTSSGGSLVWIEATNRVTVHGIISANGAAGTGLSGGGSGGGIYINCPILGNTTSGVIRANGGKGGSESGGGGGGRILIVNWFSNQFDGTFSATGGPNNGSGSIDGTNGTFCSAYNNGYSLTMTVRGSPTRHDVSTPYDYGIYAMNAGTPVTDDIALTTEQTATMRYICYGWNVTNDVGTAIASNGTTNASFTVNTNVVLTWKWTNQYYLITTAGTNGALVQDRTGWYTNGVLVTINPTADVGYAFLSWSGSGVPVGHETDNPLTVTMDQARTIQADFASTAAQARVWTGVNPWNTATNWNPTGLPGPSDTLTIQSGTSILANVASVGSVTVSNGATLMFTNWTASLSASTVTVQTNGVITHAGSNTNSAPSNTNRLQISCTTLTVDAGGRIDADNVGFVGGVGDANGQGPGGGFFVSNSGGGGGYGGTGIRGNPGHNSLGGPSYGSAYSPVDLGSGGGSRSGTGGAGGGAIRINATGKVTVNGRISANGQNGVSGNSGGGAGGSIYITCSSLAGTGDLQANGAGASGEGGAGGGGRIAVAYNPTNQATESPQPTIRFSASARASPYAERSQGGTIYLPNAVFFPNRITDLIRNTNRVVGVTSWAPNTLVVSNGFVSFEESGFVLQVTNDIVLPGPYSELTVTNAAVSCANLAVSNNSTFTANRGTNSLDSFTVSGNIALDNATMTYFYALTNPASLTIGGAFSLTNNSKLYLYSGLTNSGIVGDYGGLFNQADRALMIPTNCVIYPYSHPTNGGNMKLVVRSLFVAAGGQLNGNGGGFGARTNVNSRGYGPGGGYGNSSGGGGGHGGKGGDGNPGHGSNAGGPSYGSSNTPPMHAGSCGGRGGGVGGSGGSLIWVEASSRITVNGAVTANGAPGSGYAGGGAGGGIYLVCNTFAGSAPGALTATGGVCGAESGGGAGGRIQVWAVNNLSVGLTISTNGAPGYLGGATTGGDGSFYWVSVRPSGTVFVIH